ncbi:MAG: hypothetical protein QXI68_01740 [Sulfolobales archaeon]
MIHEWPIKSKVSRFIKAWRAVNEIREMKIGVIGEPSPWLIYSSGPEVENNLTNIFDGLRLLRINLRDLYEELMKESNDKSDDLLEKILDKSKVSKVSKEAVKTSLMVYHAVSRLLKRYDLDAATIRCFDIIGELDTTACLAASLLNERRAVLGCEGDLPSLITMILSSKLSDSPTFMANLVWIDGDKFTFAHCTVPLSMVNRFELDKHYESGRGVGIRGYFTKGKDVTLVRLDPVSRVIRYATGKMLTSGTINKQLCRTQLKIKIPHRKINDSNIFIRKAIGNHYVIVLRNISEELEYASRIIGIESERM